MIVVLLALSGCGIGAVTATPSRMNVLVYNIHAGKDAAGDRNLERVTRLIEDRDADVALLQEVDRGTERSGREDQPATLERLTGHAAVFGRTLDYQGGEYGIAILSRLPISGAATIPMQVEPPQERAGGSYEPRGILLASVRSRAGVIHVLNTHLDASRTDHYRRQEVEQLLGLADSLRARGEAVLVGGDLNAEPESEVIGRLIRAGWRDAWAECGSGPGLTFSTAAPVKRIDYLFMAGNVRCVRAEIPNADASDHRPLLVELEHSRSRRR